MKGPATTRRAEEFDALISGRSTAADGGRYDDLLAVVSELRAVPEAPARPEFVASLRTQLVAAAERQAAPVDQSTADRLTPRQRQGSRERRVAAVFGGFAVVAASGSMAMASQGALPGDALYPVKRAIENAQVNLASDDTAKAEKLLAQANSRLSEVESLAARGEATDSAEIRGALTEFKDQSHQAATLLIETGDSAGISDLRSFNSRNISRLTDLEDVLPTDSRPALVAAAQTLVQLDDAAFQACPECGDGQLSQLPQFSLQSLSTMLDSGSGPLTLPGAPKIDAKDLAKGDKAAEQAKNEPNDDPTATPSADPSDNTDPTDSNPDKAGPDKDRPTGIVRNTVENLVETLIGNSETGEPGLLGSVTGLLGLNK